MARLGKLETRRLLQAIESKAKKLWLSSTWINFSTKDMEAIERIVQKYMKQMKR